MASYRFMSMARPQVEDSGYCSRRRLGISYLRKIGSVFIRSFFGYRELSSDSVVSSESAVLKFLFVEQRCKTYEEENLQTVDTIQLYQLCP